MFEHSVIQGSNDLIRLIKKLWLGSNTSHSFLKPPLAILDLPCPSIIPFFGLSTSLVPLPFHFLSISLDKMERIQPNLVW